ELLGYTVEEWLASPGNWARSLHPDDNAMVVAERTRSNAQVAPFEAEYRMVVRDGRVVWVHDTASVVRDASGQPAFRQGVVYDITNRKVMEMALKESEERYRDLFENANDIVFVLDLQGRFLSVNRAGETATGYMRQREEPLYLEQVVAPEHLGTARQAVAKMASGGAPLLFELELLTQDGRRLPLEVGTRPIVRDGQPVGVQGIARDITEQKRAQDSLRESETRFRTIFEEAPVGIALVDADHRILKSNRRLSDILGYTEEELISLTIDELTYPEDVGKDMDLADRLLRGDIPGYKLETRLVRKDGEVRYAQLTTTFIRGQEGKPVHGLGMVEDITERKVQEERISLQINRLDALRSIDMAITSSLDPRVTFDVLLDHVITQLHSDAATILLLDPHSHYLQYAAGRGFRTAALRHTSLRLGEGHAGRAALERSLISVQNLGENPGDFTRAPLLNSEGFVSYFVAPLIAKAQVKGVLEIFCREPFDPSQEWLDYLETLGGQGAIAIDNATLFDDLQRSNTDLTLAYDTTLEGWARALDLRDRETEGHSRRVADLAVRLGRVVGMSEAELVHLRRGALLHDIGKLGIPDSILLKPGPLAEKEWEEMRKHPVYAYEMLAPIAFLHQALDIPYCHHEKWDGTGYPRGIKEDQIPLPARIFAVVDVWEALSSDRPYRVAWPEDKVREYIAEGAGRHFDPKAVKTFLGDGLL
ncbi:MAG: PAS domain S-box protein, partial [Dehalococcoidia bacterium]|nr:PAS domain S-box protein [Dehalococcoidia bacterium]